MRGPLARNPVKAKVPEISEETGDYWALIPSNLSKFERIKRDSKSLEVLAPGMVVEEGHP